MIKYKQYRKILWCFLTAVVCLLGTSAMSQQTGNQQSTDNESVRDDPFAQFTTPSEPPKTQPVTEPIDTEEEEEEEEEIPPLFVKTVMLKFLDAESLEQVISNMSSEYGSIASNKKNNSVIVCDTQECLERIISEIKKADKTPQQVMIEVVILDVQLNDDTEIGINWDILSDKMYDFGYRQNFTSSRLGSTVEDATTIGDTTAFNTTGLGGSFSVISGTIRNVVHLIQQKRNVEILASPRVMMVSGETASIEAVEELPYTEISDTASGGAGALTTTRFKNVGVQLNVVATVTDSNEILLTVDTEQNVATGQSNTEVPIVDTRKAHTSLLLNNAQVVVFGGLRRQEITKEVDQVPILGNLPIIGFLFKSTNNVVKNSELIIFLSPHIYKGEPVPENVMSRYNKVKAESPLSPSKDESSSKEVLLKRIKMLQNENSEEASDELLSTLSSLEKILSREIYESIALSEKAIADDHYVEDINP